MSANNARSRRHALATVEATSAFPYCFCPEAAKSKINIQCKGEQPAKHPTHHQPLCFRGCIAFELNRWLFNSLGNERPPPPSSSRLSMSLFSSCASNYFSPRAVPIQDYAHLHLCVVAAIFYLQILAAHCVETSSLS
jgi:hypothetical protein